MKSSEPDIGNWHGRSFHLERRYTIGKYLRLIFPFLIFLNPSNIRLSPFRSKFRIMDEKKIALGLAVQGRFTFKCMEALSNTNEEQFRIVRSKANKQVFYLIDPKTGGMICEFQKRSTSSSSWSIRGRGLPYCLIEERSLKEKMDTWNLKEVFRQEWRLFHEGERIANIYHYGIWKNPSWTMKGLNLPEGFDSRIAIASLLLLAGLYD